MTAVEKPAARARGAGRAAPSVASSTHTPERIELSRRRHVVERGDEHLERLDACLDEIAGDRLEAGVGLAGEHDAKAARDVASGEADAALERDDLYRPGDASGRGGRCAARVDDADLRRRRGLRSRASIPRGRPRRAAHQAVTQAAVAGFERRSRRWRAEDVETVMVSFPRSRPRDSRAVRPPRVPARLGQKSFLSMMPSPSVSRAVGA